MNPARCDDLDYIQFLIAAQTVSNTEAARCDPRVEAERPAHDAYTRLLRCQPPDSAALWAEVERRLALKGKVARVPPSHGELLAMIVGLVPVAFHAKSVSADLNFNPYIYSGGTIKDPINVLFINNGSLWSSDWEIGYHFGWTDQGGSTLQFIDHGTTENMQAQRASACIACNRYHIRFNQGNDSGGSFWGTWTMGPIHYEVLTWCGHAATTFNSARDYVISGMSGHTWGYHWLGNNAAVQQCDGRWTAGDGWAKYVIT